jgi:hypothetical protein
MHFQLNSKFARTVDGIGKYSNDVSKVVSEGF